MLIPKVVTQICETLSPQNSTISFHYFVFNTYVCVGVYLSVYAFVCLVFVCVSVCLYVYIEFCIYGSVCVHI